MLGQQSDEGPFQRFRKTIWFRIVLLVLLGVASALILFGVGCLSLIAVPLLIFAIPYWLKERNVKAYLLNGIVVFVLAFFILNTLQTSFVMTSAKPDVSVAVGEISLNHGTVEPYVGGAGDYRFSVIYSSVTPVNATDVTLTMQLFEYNSQNTQKYAMIGNTSGSAAVGWTYEKVLTLTEGVWFFNFTATTVYSSGYNIVSTTPRLGPLNAGWGAYFSTWMIFVLLDVLLAFFMYGIILGIYWWSQRMKVIRGPMQSPAKTGSGGDFECTNCGADVSEDATRCPRCGAVFEDEPLVRAKKVEKETYSVLGAKDKDEKRKETR